ncbi:MAG: APC family permease [Chloroflexi bacterium]|nr:APC family permease [Chloroflexota bacterium]
MIIAEKNESASHDAERRPPTQFIKNILIGPRLLTADAPHQTIGKAIGLAVFASDALSSTAYATDEILIVLALAGAGALTFSLPVAIAIMILLAIVTFSYEQTIHAYPNGGGAYIVARDNLGEGPAQTAGAALLTDYILTVAVSISSGVAQITSAFPELLPYRVWISLGIILVMTLINLRGVKESGSAFSLPTYFFLGMTLFTIGLGFYHYFSGTLSTVTDVEMMHDVTQDLTLFLILKAFSSGCTALTGVEAISNGITAFNEPKSRNAGITLLWMSSILSVMFFGITFLAGQMHALPSHTETIFSQLGRTIYGKGSPMYLALLGGTTLILIMAANTSYADFPRLGALHAGDGCLPKQLTYRGSRLVFTWGILALAGFASLLIILFNAETTALIPLYAIGVFLSFTLSQSGMAVRWWKISKLKVGDEVKQLGSTLRFDPKWKGKMIVNGFGAVATFVVMIVFALSKFRDGAWIVVILIPTLVFIFFRIHHHYRDLAKDLSLDSFGAPPRIRRNRVIVPIGGVHRGTLRAMHFARSLSEDVTAVYVAIDGAEEAKVQTKWAKWGDGLRLKIIPSPYRFLYEPLLDYIQFIARQRKPNEILTVVVPEFVPTTWWHNLLHTQTAFFLRLGLLGMKDIVIMEVPYHVGEHD